MHFVIGTLIFILFISGCPKTDGSREKTPKGSADNSAIISVPAIPPGFETIDELGEFDIFDNTVTAKHLIQKVVLSANWSAEKNFDKPWSDFTEQEKHEFDALVETLVTKITKIVEAQGGAFSVNRPIEGMFAGSVYGQWIVRHDDKYAVALWEAPAKWRVDFNAHKTALDTPTINMFIARCVIQGEE